MSRLARILFMSTVLGAAAVSPANAIGQEAGQVYEIRFAVTTEGSDSDGGKSNSRSSFSLIERVIAVTSEGTEFEIDLTADASPEERTRHWQYPARLIRLPDHSLRLLNTAELEARITAWLEAAEIPRASCGRWIFTWNAFKIECDPQSVVQDIALLDLASIAADHRQPSPRVEEMPVDPEVVRQERVTSDEVVREIMAASSAEGPTNDRENERISGNVRTTVTLDNDANAITRQKVTTVTIERPDGVVENQTSSETVERRLHTPAVAR